MTVTMSSSRQRKVKEEVGRWLPGAWDAALRSHLWSCGESSPHGGQGKSPEFDACCFDVLWLPPATGSASCSCRSPAGVWRRQGRGLQQSWKARLWYKTDLRGSSRKFRGSFQERHFVGLIRKIIWVFVLIQVLEVVHYNCSVLSC